MVCVFCVWRKKERKGFFLSNLGDLTVISAGLLAASLSIGSDQKHTHTNKKEWHKTLLLPRNVCAPVVCLMKCARYWDPHNKQVGSENDNKENESASPSKMHHSATNTGFSLGLCVCCFSATRAYVHLRAATRKEGTMSEASLDSLNIFPSTFLPQPRRAKMCQRVCSVLKPVLCLCFFPYPFALLPASFSTSPSPLDPHTYIRTYTPTETTTPSLHFFLPTTMVTTRKHPEGGGEQMLGEEGRKPQAEKQTGQIAKKSKTHPLQEADRELEEGLEKQVSKEKAELGKEGLEEPEEGGEGEEFQPAQEEEREEEEEEEEEEGAEGEEEEEEEMEARKLPAGGQEETEGQAGGAKKQQQQQQQQQQKGKGKGKAVAAGAGAKGLQVGEPAPDFSLQNQDGETISLKDFKGKHVAIYFYNKDDTPVVTKGGSAFAEVFPQMEKMGVPLLFIGPDR